MTETVFSQSSEASSTELCLQCPCMLSKILTLFSRLFWKKDEDFSCHKNVYVVSFCTNGITLFMEVLIITPRPRTLFRTKSPWFHLGNDATPAGRGWYRRRDLVRLGRTENPSKSQLSHFFENDNKWIRLQHHVFSPLEQENKCCRGCGTKLHF